MPPNLWIHHHTAHTSPKNDLISLEKILGLEDEIFKKFPQLRDSPFSGDEFLHFRKGVAPLPPFPPARPLVFEPPTLTWAAKVDRPRNNSTG